MLNEGLLVNLVALWGRHRAQPQRDVGGLHRLPDHPHQFVIQCLQVCLVAQFGGEGFQRLSCIVPAAVRSACL
jgi:hypothetical protein